MSLLVDKVKVYQVMRHLLNAIPGLMIGRVDMHEKEIPHVITTRLGKTYEVRVYRTSYMYAADKEGAIVVFQVLNSIDENRTIRHFLARKNVEPDETVDRVHTSLLRLYEGQPYEAERAQ